MFDKFDAWQYRDDNNCWDFVRLYQIEVLGVPADDIPTFNINPKDKRSMTRAAIYVAKNYIECGPINGAVASHYNDNCILHVGIIENGVVRHTGKHLTPCTQRTSINDFEAMAKKTVYRIHKSLWQS